ncbi:MAG: hypothetical protein H6709_20410 [Kofleriaceae bacterium]|nr:hypothetical protein [Kofleriaceae bacterium]
MPRRVTGIILVAVAAALIVAAIVPRRWWRLDGGDQARTAVGLRTIERCGADLAGDPAPGCAVTPVGALARATPGDDVFDRAARDEVATFVVVGRVATGVGVVAALLALALAGHAARREVAPPRLLTTAATAAAAAFALVVAIAVAVVPRVLDPIPHGSGPVLSLAGALLAVAGARVLAAYDPAFEGARVTHPGRVPGVAVTVAGVALLVVAVTLAPWWTGQRGGARVQIDLLGMRACADGACVARSMAQLDDHAAPGGGFFGALGALVRDLAALGTIAGALAVVFAAAACAAAAG